MPEYVSWQHKDVLKEQSKCPVCGNWCSLGVSHACIKPGIDPNFFNQVASESLGYDHLVGGPTGKLVQDSMQDKGRIDFNPPPRELGKGDPLTTPMHTAKDSHYKRMKIEPLDYARENDLDAYETKIIKYVSRAPYKGKHTEDLEKARDILDRLLDQVKAGYVPLRGRK